MPADTNKKRKYKLFSTTDDRPNKEKPCAFFFSDAGCRNADKCSFSHDKASQQQASAADSASAPPSTPAVAAVEAAPIESKATEKKARKEKKATPPVVPPAPPATPMPAPSSQMSFMQASIAEQQAKIDELRKQLEASNQPVIPVKVKEMTRSVTKKQKPRRQQPQPESSCSSSSCDSDSDSSESSVDQSRYSNSKPSATASAPRVATNAPNSPTPASAAATATATKAKTAKGGLAANFLVPCDVPSASMPAPTSTKKEKVLKTPAKTPRTKGREEKAQEQEEDTAFLFGIVNTALNAETPNQKPIGKGFEAKDKHSSSSTIRSSSSTMLPMDALSQIPTKTTTTPTPTTTTASINTGAAPSRDRSVSFGSSSTTSRSNGKFAIPLGDFPFVEATRVMDMLSTSGTDHATEGSTTSSKEKKARVEKLDSADMTALHWGSLVAKTQSQPRFATDYKWDRDSTWVQAKEYGDWCQNLQQFPPVIAIDCEMCETMDPVTGAKDGCTLIRFSVVDGLNPSHVLIDEIVQPNAPITDARTHIHSITIEQIQNVKNYTLRHAQAALMNICSNQTIIVGHSVHNDLKALHFYHTKCIDTAYLFTVVDEPGASPSMRDVAQHVLADTLCDAHDSIIDARASLKAAAYLLLFNEASPCPRANGIALQASLLVHRIPEGCTDIDIFKMVSSYTNVCPVDIASTTASANGTGSKVADSTGATKLNIMFRSKAHAELAFDSIPGPNRPDKSGRAQKRVYYKSAHGASGYLCIRKNTRSSADN